MEIEDDFDFGLNINFDFDYEKKPEEKKEKIIAKQGRSTCLERQTKQIYRRAFSETNLLDLVSEFKEGYSYNFITGGDVDALSYLKLILRHQKLDYCLLSTWCIAMEDIFQLEEFLEKGLIKKLDCYVGEIFPNSYKNEYKKLKEIMNKFSGKIVVFKNHSKIFAGYGEKFHFGVQSSANINTNPRTENGCITISKDIFDFYFEYYNGIKSFEKELINNG